MTRLYITAVCCDDPTNPKMYQVDIREQDFKNETDLIHAFLEAINIDDEISADYTLNYFFQLDRYSSAHLTTDHDGMDYMLTFTLYGSDNDERWERLIQRLVQSFIDDPEILKACEPQDVDAHKDEEKYYSILNSNHVLLLKEVASKITAQN